MKTFFKHLFIFLFIASASFLVAEFVLAQTPDVGREQVDENVALSDADPRMVIARIVQIALGFLGILAVALIVYAGYMWMTSAGNADRIEKAKSIIKNAIIGLVIILSAFGIVSFIIAQFTSPSPGGGGDRSPGGGGIEGGTGALGSCSLETVYPEPNQKEIPRNSSIIVTFREEVDSSSVCNEDPNDDNEVCDGENIRTDGRIKIYQSETDPSLEENWLSNVSVQETEDHKTFVLIPQDHLGSSSEFIWYTVYLSNDIQTRAGGTGVFTNCKADYYNWQFEVSNELDLKPPRIKEKGMFPPPDDQRDNASTTQEAETATGKIEVVDQPDVYSVATSTGVTALGDSPPAEVEVAESCSRDGGLTVAVKTDGVTAQLQQGDELLGESTFSGTTVDFPGYLSLTVTEGSFGSGDSWEVQVEAMSEADTLTVGSTEYTFVDTSSDNTQIGVGANTVETASNISSVIGLDPDINASSQNSVVNITAASPGKDGNNIALSTSDEESLNITEMSGGQDREDDVAINDMEDQPRNSIIQINFNEAINPITLSGKSSSLSDYIRIKCLSGDCSNNDYFFDCGDSRCVKGEFLISNQYSTVEFRSNNQCGTNSCGQPIYCLPGNSNLTVEMKAAQLDECENDEDCAARSPYSGCSDEDASVPVCVDDQETATTSDDLNYPMADNTLMNGVMDVALNSFDGNRDGEAQGPISYFDQNAPDPDKGDNYLWSFYINNDIKIDPPAIDNTSPSHTGNLEDLGAPVDIDFSGLMMSDSLSTGSSLVSGVEHKLINLWSSTDSAVGYWVSKDNIDVNTPLDGWPDITRAHLDHMMLDSSVTYRSQAGSGVLDIYQNCFKPSDGPACSGVSDNQPSCCAGTAISTTTEEGNCP